MSLVPFALFLLLLPPVTYTWDPRVRGFFKSTEGERIAVPFALFLLLLLPPVTYTWDPRVRGFLSQLRGRESPPENFFDLAPIRPGKV
jgi:hypothetical protein